MKYADFNPAECLRSIDALKVARLNAKLDTATLQELRELNAKRFAIAQGDRVIAGLWAINLEFTRRGIAPRWRGIERFNPSAVPNDRPKYGLPDDVPQFRGTQMLQKLLLRWADLDWLRRALGPAHYATNRAWLRVFADQHESERERLFAQVAESADQPHRIVHDLAVTGAYALALKGFAVSKAGDRCRVIVRPVPFLCPLRLAGTIV